jgi:hypothetical protein
MAHVRSVAKDSGVKVELHKSKFVYADGLKSSGYFDEEEKKLVCAIDKPLNQWIEIFVHEYSHLEQWATDCFYWRRSVIHGRDAYGSFSSWLQGEEEHSKKTLKKYAGICRCLEMDCERRAVENVKKFNLPIDLEIYCQRANAYVIFYNFALMTRLWYKRPAYARKEVYQAFPKQLVQRHDRLPKKYIKLYQKYCV